MKLVKYSVLTCCAMHKLCECHGEDYGIEWAVPAAVTVKPVVPLSQGVETFLSLISPHAVSTELYKVKVPITLTKT